MMQKIYGIPKPLAEFINFAIENDMPFEEIKDTLESLGCDDYLDGLVLEIKNNESLAKSLKDEKAALGKRQTIFENAAKRIRGHILLPLLKSMGETSVRAEHGTISVRKGKEKMNIDESQLPEEYFAYEYVKRVDIDKIKLDSADGKDINGVSFEVSPETISIR
ncbi:siphovirus Gp157 family protein [Vibrio parahaemolyticus]|nr:siphovirus Gp157 family protein [Vibrio parahaemolyticus]